MKILQLAQRNCAFVGLIPLQSGTAATTQQYPINRKSMQTFFVLCLALGSCGAYLSLEAKTFQEVAVSVYISSSLLLGFVAFVIFVWKNQSVFELIENGEKLIDAGEFERCQRTLTNGQKSRIFIVHGRKDTTAVR